MLDCSIRLFRPGISPAFHVTLLYRDNYRVHNVQYATIASTRYVCFINTLINLSMCNHCDLSSEIIKVCTLHKKIIIIDQKPPSWRLGSVLVR